MSLHRTASRQWHPAIVWFPRPDQISHFMKQWKQRSSVQIKRLIRSCLIRYAGTIDLASGGRGKAEGVPRD